MGLGTLCWEVAHSYHSTVRSHGDTLFVVIAPTIAFIYPLLRGCLITFKILSLFRAGEIIQQVRRLTTPRNDSWTQIRILLIFQGVVPGGAWGTMWCLGSNLAFLSSKAVCWAAFWPRYSQLPSAPATLQSPLQLLHSIAVISLFIWGELYCSYYCPSRIHFISWFS